MTLKSKPVPSRVSALGGGASRAFSLIEAMILVTILGIVGAGAGIGLQSTIHTPKAVDNIVAINAGIVSAMETMRANALSNFAGLTGYSDTVTINLKTYPR